MLRSSDREVLFLRQFSVGKTNVWENQNSLLFASEFFWQINRQEQTLERISPPYSWWLNRKNEYEEGKLFIVWPQDQSGSRPSLNPWQKRWVCILTPLISTNTWWNNPILMSLVFTLGPFSSCPPFNDIYIKQSSLEQTIHSLELDLSR